MTSENILFDILKLESKVIDIRASIKYMLLGNPRREMKLLPNEGRTYFAIEDGKSENMRINEARIDRDVTVAITTLIKSLMPI